MKVKQMAQVALIALAAAGVAYCGGDDLDDEIDDVVEEQQEAAEQAAETPFDTAAIRREGQDVEDEQKDVQEAMKDKLEDEGLTTSN